MKNGLVFLRLLATASLLGFLTACATFQSSSDSTPVTPPSKAEQQSPDLLRAGDKITIFFSDVINQPMPPHEQQIREDGTVSPPLVGTVPAAGRTKSELEKDIQDRYIKGNFFRRLTVTVKTDDRVFYVGGEVRAPSRQIYAGEMSVLKAIRAAGDFTDFADKRHVRINRANKRSEIINCNKALKDPKLDVPIYPGDSIHVPRRIV